MNTFIWLDKYNIGNKTIDEQHKYLFQLANQIISPLNANAVKTNVMLLFRYVREHFSAEEALMKQSNYPGYQEHLKKHDVLIEKLNEISANLNNGKATQDDIMIFMSSWLLDHILDVDSLLGNHLHPKID